MEHILIGGVLDGEIRSDINGAIYMAPRVGEKGKVHWQIYNRIDLQERIDNLQKFLDSKKNVADNIEPRDLVTRHDLRAIKARVAEAEQKLAHYKKYQKRNGTSAFEFYREE